jgi:hypothetical protein
MLKPLAEYWPLLTFTLHVIIDLCVSSDIVLRKTDTRPAAESKIVTSIPVTLDGLRNRPIVCRLRDGFARLASQYL